MSEAPDLDNRLKSAVNGVDVPPALAAGIMGRIRAEQAQSDASARLRSAVKSEPVPPFLEARIRSRLRAERPGRRRIIRLVPGIAAAAMLGGVLIAYQLGHLRLTVNSQESYYTSLSTQVAGLMRVGLGDHIHCAYFRKFPANAPSPQEFVSKLGPEYAGLLPIVREYVPGSYRLMLAHQCRYHGRKFVHLSLLDNGHLMSVVLSRKNGGESFSAEGMLPSLVQSGIPMYQSNAQRFQLSAFESRDYLVYVISDLPRQKNAELMIAMAPPVKDFLKNLEL